MEKQQELEQAAARMALLRRHRCRCRAPHLCRPGARQQLLPHVGGLDRAIVSNHVAAAEAGNGSRGASSHHRSKHSSNRPKDSQPARGAVSHDSTQLRLLFLILIREEGVLKEGLHCCSLPPPPPLASTLWMDVAIKDGALRGERRMLCSPPPACRHRAFRPFGGGICGTLSPALDEQMHLACPWDLHEDFKYKDNISWEGLVAACHDSHCLARRCPRCKRAFNKRRSGTKRLHLVCQLVSTQGMHTSQPGSCWHLL